MGNGVPSQDPLSSANRCAGRRRTEAARTELAEANRGLQAEISERKRTERWLLESEQRFRAYFEQGLVGMAMLSPCQAIIGGAKGTWSGGKHFALLTSARAADWPRCPTRPLAVT